MTEFDPVSVASGQGIKSVRKACAILEALGETRRGMRISELAVRLQMTPSTVSRLVSTLEGSGLVDQDQETGRCYVGIGMALLGNAALGRRELDRVSHPVMAELASRFDENVNLSRLHRGRVLYLRGRSSEQLLRADIQLAAVLPVHASAPGKILLAWRTTDEVVAILKARGMDVYTGNTINSVDAFVQQLAEVRDTGMAMDEEELVYGLRGVATPIRDHFGNVVASLSTGASTERLKGEKLGALTQALTSGALEISRALGYASL